MTIVPTAELASQLPHILEALAAGEEVVLTQSGQAVARIVPPANSAGQGLAAAQRRQEFDAWMKLVEDGAERYPSGFVLDDSYDAIYGEREDPQR